MVTDMLKKRRVIMSKKTWKVIGTFLTVMTLILMFFPWISAYHSGEVENVNLTATGFGLTEFSVWGVILLIMPIIILATIYSRLNSKVKTVMILAIYLFSQISLYCAVSAGMEFLREVSTQYVRPQVWMLLHPVIIFLSLLSFYLSYNQKGSSELYPADIYNEEFVLFDRNVAFLKYKKGEQSAEFDGCISFATAEGHFAALGHGEDVKYITDGFLEAIDGDDSIGYAAKTTSYGIYGWFYKDCFYPQGIKMKIKPFADLEVGVAELWIPNEGDGFLRKKVKLDFGDIKRIECSVIGEALENTNIDGAVITQGRRLVAVVSGYDEIRGAFTCVSAETVAADLMRMIADEKAWVLIRERNEKSTKIKHD